MMGSFLIQMLLMHQLASGLSFQPPTRWHQCTSFRSGGVRHTRSSSLGVAFDPTTLLQEASKFSFNDLENMNLIGIAQLGVPVAAILGFAVARTPSKLLNKSALDAIVDNTYLQPRKGSLECVYKASKDGWSAIAFHEAVDEKGSGVVVARGITGQTFGGYNPNGWRSTDDYYSSSAAFLWCLKGGKVVKLPVLPGGNCAVFDYATSGPCFGATDFVIGPPRAAVMGGFAGPDSEDISKSAGNLRSCKSSVGATYEWDRAWPVRGGMQLVDVEIYCVAS